MLTNLLYLHVKKVKAEKEVSLLPANGIVYHQWMYIHTDCYFVYSLKPCSLYTKLAITLLYTHQTYVAGRRIPFPSPLLILLLEGCISHTKCHAIGIVWKYRKTASVKIFINFDDDVCTHNLSVWVSAGSTWAHCFINLIYPFSFFSCYP